MARRTARVGVLPAEATLGNVPTKAGVAPRPTSIRVGWRAEGPSTLAAPTAATAATTTAAALMAERALVALSADVGRPAHCKRLVSSCRSEHWWGRSPAATFLVEEKADLVDLARPTARAEYM